MNRWMVGAVAGLCCHAAAGAQDLATTKQQAEIDQIRANTQKVRVETEAARIGLESAPFAPLKGMGASGSATVAEGGKTAEALILNRATLDAMADRLVNALATANIQPGNTPVWIVVGQQPPSLAAWQAFASDRKTVGDDLDRTARAWRGSNSNSNYKLFLGDPVTGAIALVGAIAPLLKTDTVVAGSDRKIDDSQLILAVQRSLSRRGYPLDDGGFAVTNGIETADALMAPIASSYAMAKAAYDEGAATVIGDKNASVAKKKKAQELANALASYDALRRNLTTTTGDTMLATTIAWQRDKATALATTPILYLVAREAAVTSMTKKNFLSGFGSTPAYLSSVVIVDYAIAPPAEKPVIRGEVRCFARRQRFDEIGTARAADAPSLCS